MLSHISSKYVCATERDRVIPTMEGRVARTGQHIVRSKLEVKVLLAEKTIHKCDELQYQLVLSQVVPHLKHHLAYTQTTPIKTTPTIDKMERGRGVVTNPVDVIVDGLEAKLSRSQSTLKHGGILCYNTRHLHNGV